MALLVIVAAAGLWALLRFGLMSWLLSENHPLRPAVEGLSWLVAILSFPVAVSAFVLQLRAERRKGTPASAPSQPDVTINDGVHGHGSGPTIGVMIGGQVANGGPKQDPPGPERA